MQVKTRQVARQLGITYWHLISLLRSDKLPPPAKDASGDFVWSRRDLANARRALSLGRRKRGVPIS